MRRCPRSQTLSYLIGGLPCLFPWQGETRHSWCWSSPNCVQLLTLTPCPCKQRLLFFKNAAKISSSSACNALEKPWHNIGDMLPSPLTEPNPTAQHPTWHLWRCPSSRWAQPVAWSGALRLNFCSDMLPPLGPLMQWTTCRKVGVLGKVTPRLFPEVSNIWILSDMGRYLTSSVP